MTFAQIVKEEFTEHKTRTLQQLYKTLDANPDVELEGSTLETSY